MYKSQKEQQPACLLNVMAPLTLSIRPVRLKELVRLQQKVRDLVRRGRQFFLDLENNDESTTSSTQCLQKLTSAQLTKIFFENHAAERAGEVAGTKLLRQQRLKERKNISEPGCGNGRGVGALGLKMIDTALHTKPICEARRRKVQVMGMGSDP